MAKKNLRAKIVSAGFCIDCEYSYDYYNSNYEGVLIMCRCKLSNYSKILRNNCNIGKFAKKD